MNSTETKVTHTPGPWTADKHYVHANECRFIAVSGTAPNHGSHLEAEANARLIAAAPELLLALKNLEWVINWHESQGRFSAVAMDDKHRQDARAVIAKAEGRAS